MDKKHTVYVGLNSETAIENFNNVFKSVSSLPSISGIIFTVENMIDDPDSSASDMERVISADPALTARILRIANSAFYGLSHKIFSLSQAIAILGLNALRNIIVTAEVFEAFPVDRNMVFDRYLFWKHSIATGCASRAIAKLSNYAKYEEVFVGGLLHDIGKLVLEEFFENEFRLVLNQVKMQGISLIEAENKILGFNHCDVGKKVTTYWNFPQFYIDCAAYHYSCGKSEKFASQVSCVKLGNCFAKIFCFGSDGDGRVCEIEPELFDLLDKTGLSRNELFSLLFYEMSKGNEFLESFI